MEGAFIVYVPIRHDDIVKGGKPEGVIFPTEGG